ncbi:MAG TPA: 2-phospho-L-lactate guanylyltransferase [Solirubrobacteraceae bacterium]|jgi:2-phospho-L-lactate guanylyltransferase|nr:2-phospho-L-lactate guanylyltransferase [Solirubrobacteraceae bacterium]
MRTLAILPVKRFDIAKSRLREALEPALRERLAEAMVSDVLTTLRSCKALEAVVLVTNEPAVAATATAYGASVLADPQEAGQSAAALVGVRHALEGGCERVLLVPGDCPALDGAELAELLRPGVTPPAVTIVSDRHGTGTNALLIAPPDAIEPSFGPGSFARHHEAALAAGASWHVAEPPGLLLDIDTPEDLAVLRSGTAGGSRTRAVLEELR